MAKAIKKNLLLIQPLPHRAIRVAEEYSSGGLAGSPPRGEKAARCGHTRNSTREAVNFRIFILKGADRSGIKYSSLSESPYRVIPPSRLPIIRRARMNRCARKKKFNSHSLRRRRFLSFLSSRRSCAPYARNFLI